MNPNVHVHSCLTDALHIRTGDSHVCSTIFILVPVKDDGVVECGDQSCCLQPGGQYYNIVHVFVIVPHGELHIVATSYNILSMLTDVDFATIGFIHMAALLIKGLSQERNFTFTNM